MKQLEVTIIDVREQEHTVCIQVPVIATIEYVREQLSKLLGPMGCSLISVKLPARPRT